MLNIQPEKFSQSGDAFGTSMETKHRTWPTLEPSSLMEVVEATQVTSSLVLAEGPGLPSSGGLGPLLIVLVSASPAWGKAQTPVPGIWVGSAVMNGRGLHPLHHACPPLSPPLPQLLEPGLAGRQWEPSSSEGQGPWPQPWS